MGFLLTDPAAVALVTTMYVIAGVVFVLSDYTLNDEGLLTHYWANWALRDFVPVFFLQKVHPVLCALYAAVSAGGVRATLLAHVVVAATAMPMLASVARSLGHRLPNVSVLIVALSPLYFYGGAAGFSNTDGIVGICLVLYLLCRRRSPLAAGLVVGVLPWVRFELGVFCAVMGLYALLSKRDRPLVLGMALFPLSYIGTGILYHHDAFWVVHFPGSAPFDPGNPVYGSQLIGVRYFLEPAMALTPAAALAAMLPVGRLRPVERALLAHAVLAMLTMNVLPIFRVGNFGAAPRYLMLLLPALALLVGRALEPLWEGECPALASLLGTALLVVWLATRCLDARATQILLIGYALVLAAAWLGVGILVAAIAAVLVAAGPVLPLRTDVGRAMDTKYLDPMVAWLETHSSQIAGPIYTNVQLLAPTLERRLPAADVYLMAGIDMAREIVMLTNPDNGQRERILRLCAIDLYGKMLLPPISPEDLPGNALLVLRPGVRLPLLLPAALWTPRLEPLADTPDYVIARLRPAGPAARP